MGLKDILAAQDKAIRRAWEEEMIGVADDMETRFTRVIRTWRHKPKWRTRLRVRKTRMEMNLYPVGMYASIWGYVDRGTKPHYIFPKKKGGRLTFQTGYSARTAPVAKFNVGSGRAYGPWRSPKAVRHPGTEARKFTVTYLHDLRPPFEERMQDAVRRALGG